MFKKMSVALLFPFLLLFVWFFRPPGNPPAQRGEIKSQAAQPYLDGGRLPGVTWADDIHPIFVRNKCGKCHTRGQEDFLAGKEKFALGIIDPVEPLNPFFSYHELVYAEGPSNIIEGETLRDGQCCWPRGMAPSQQRRIWIGHPERSVLVRKLERDYYDWNTPPRFLGEGVRLRWGLPMPFWEDKERGDHGAAHDNHGVNEASGDDHGHNTAHDETSRLSAHSHDSPQSVSYWKDMAFRSLLWLGGGREQLSVLPIVVPAGDRALIRYWVKNTLWLADEGTSITVQLAAADRQGVAGKEIVLVGNFVSPSHPEVRDSFLIQTDKDGRAVFTFPANSAVSRFWHVGFVKQQKERFKAITIMPGTGNAVTLVKKQ